MPANSVFQYSPPGEFILSPPRDTVRTFVRAVKTDQKSTIPPNSVLPETLPGEFILSPPIDSVRTIIEPVKADQQSDMDISVSVSTRCVTSVQTLADLE
jgi:hypothetical protein